MIKTIGLIGICLTFLVLTGCKPQKPEVKLVATSKDAYDKSLVLMAEGLTSDERSTLSQAIEIVQENTSGISQVDSDTSQRVKVSGKTRVQIINEARQIVLDWFKNNSNLETRYIRFQQELAERVSAKVASCKKDDLDLFYDVVLEISNKSNLNIEYVSVYFDLGENVSSKLRGSSTYVSRGMTRKVLGYSTVPVKSNQVIKGLWVKIRTGGGDDDGMLVCTDSTYTVNTEFDYFLRKIGYTRKTPK